MIVFDQVNKYFGDFHVLKDINLTINKGRSGRSNRSIWIRKKYAASLY